MNTTTLEPSFLRATLQMSAFKPRPMVEAQAALLRRGLTGVEFTAQEIANVTGGNTHLAGAATGALIAQGLLEVVKRVKSPAENAKGRKLDLLRIPAGKYGTVRTWFERQQLPPPSPQQQELQLSA
jgi:hypothetical protein